MKGDDEGEGVVHLLPSEPMVCISSIFLHNIKFPLRSIGFVLRLLHVKSAEQCVIFKKFYILFSALLCANIKYDKQNLR